jgi:hypothetical protein
MYLGSVRVVVECGGAAEHGQQAEGDDQEAGGARQAGAHVRGEEGARAAEGEHRGDGAEAEDQHRQHALADRRGGGGARRERVHELTGEERVRHPEGERRHRRRRPDDAGEDAADEPVYQGRTAAGDAGEDAEHLEADDDHERAREHRERAADERHRDGRHQGRAGGAREPADQDQRVHPAQVVEELPPAVSSSRREGERERAAHADAVQRAGEPAEERHEIGHGARPIPRWHAACKGRSSCCDG